MRKGLRERRLKMCARRRSPLVLLVGVVTGLAAAPAAAAQRLGGGRRAAAAVTRPLSRSDLGLDPRWQEIPTARGAAIAEPAGPMIGPPAPPPRLAMHFLAGWHHAWPTGPLWEYRRRNLLTLDLGLNVRGDDGHRWGGAVAGYWYQGNRRNLAVKALRRWTLEEASGSYAQVAPGILVAGDDVQVQLHPGLLLEAELGNRWVALAGGLHAQPWQGRVPYDGPERTDLDLVWTLGGRVHGAIGAGVVAVLYLGLAVTFAAGGGWD